MYSIQNKHAKILLNGVTAVGGPGANAQLTLGTFDANGVSSVRCSGDAALILLGFNQSQVRYDGIRYGGIGGAQQHFDETNLDSTGFSAYSPIAVTASAAFNRWDASVSIPSCSSMHHRHEHHNEENIISLAAAWVCLVGRRRLRDRIAINSVGASTATVTNGTANADWQRTSSNRK